MYQKKNVKQDQTQADEEKKDGANPFNLNVNANVFVPRADDADGTKNDGQDGKEGDKKTDGTELKKEGSFDFGGYQNPYQDTIDIEKEKKKQLDQELEDETNKTYSIDFVMSLRD